MSFSELVCAEPPAAWCPNLFLRVLEVVEMNSLLNPVVHDDDINLLIGDAIRASDNGLPPCRADARNHTR